MPPLLSITALASTGESELGRGRKTDGCRCQSLPVDSHLWPTCGEYSNVGMFALDSDTYNVYSFTTFTFL